MREVRTRVLTKTEAHVDGLGGRPDIGVEVQDALCGHVELKAPGAGAQAQRFKGRDRAQWQKFKALPNLIYTDACEWALYRSGDLQPADAPELVRLDGVIERGAAALTEQNLAQLYRLLTDFLDWGFIAPTGPKALAETLAPICRLLRDDVALAVAKEGSALRRLSAEMRDYLFPHASDEDFADIYAQTLTYALLLARLNGETLLTTASAAARLDSRHGLLAETLRVLTQSLARAEIDLPMSLLERVIGAVDPVRLGRRGDPWLYFYEDFLSAHDPKRRKEYGVYYTPQQVVGCQTALVAELLDKAFNKPMSFADEGVVMLDSSAGTSACPLAAIEFALRKVEESFGPGAVAEYATRCAQNIYAFEVLVGPYTVSHLRLTKLLSDAGATLPPGGLNVYLTDTLESPHVDPPQPPLMAERLTQEPRRARRVKADVPIFVSMGNPLAATRSFADVDWLDCFAEAGKPLLPTQTGDYFSWPEVTDVWPWQHSGIQLKRSWPIGETGELLSQPWKALMALPGGLRGPAFHEAPDRQISAHYKALNATLRLPSISSLPADAPHPPIVRDGWRSLDRAWLILNGCRIRRPDMRACCVWATANWARCRVRYGRSAFQETTFCNPGWPSGCGTDPARRAVRLMTFALPNGTSNCRASCVSCSGCLKPPLIATPT